MLKILIGIFLVLHGLVHVLYAGQSWRWFEMEEGMRWPDGSWLFGMLLSQAGVRNLAALACVLAALLFVIAGAGMFFEQGWWRSATIGAALFSSLVFLLFWDGGMDHLARKGGVGLVINIILIAVAFFDWPHFDF